MNPIVALIPARGGSKSIPRKNLVPLNGKPLIAYSIEQALRSRHIGHAIVSTDDPEIAEAARRFGAEVPFLRPAEFARDESTDLDVFRHFLGEWQRAGHPDPAAIVHLRPTGPVRKIELIDSAIERFLAEPRADSLRAVSWPIQTPYKMWRIGAGGYLELLLPIPGMPESHSMPRQALPETFWQNGYVDIVRPRTVRELHSMTGRRVLPFVVQEPIYEIDYPESLPAVAAALARLERGESLDTAADAGPRHPV